MRKKAVIFDLDNTVYSVYSIGDELFAPLLRLLEGDESIRGNMDAIRDQIMRRPFQKVAEEYGFSEEVKKQGTEILEGLTYEGEMKPFDDYEFVRSLKIDKYLVTTGFIRMQQSKVNKLNLDRDFREIYIVDPSTTDRTKKDVFADILERQGYTPEEVLVIGDDLDSEIRAARDLGIEAVLYDHLKRHDDNTDLPVRKITDFQQLQQLL